MKLLVCGSRDWPERDLWFVDARMIERASGQDGPVHVITGGARGVDRRADACATRCSASFTREVFRAEWEPGPETRVVKRRNDGTLYDPEAGLRRNLLMLDQGPDLVLAFQHNDSGGTQHTIDNAEERGIPVEVHTELPPPDLAAIDYEEEPITLGLGPQAPSRAPSAGLSQKRGSDV